MIESLTFETPDIVIYNRDGSREESVSGDYSVGAWVSVNENGLDINLRHIFPQIEKRMKQKPRALLFHRSWVSLFHNRRSYSQSLSLPRLDS